MGADKVTAAAPAYATQIVIKKPSTTAVDDIADVGKLQSGLAVTHWHRPSFLVCLAARTIIILPTHSLLTVDDNIIYFTF